MCPLKLLQYRNPIQVQPPESLVCASQLYNGKIHVPPSCTALFSFLTPTGVHSIYRFFPFL